MTAEAAEAASGAGAWRLGYQPALDGVRALAIVAVLLVHLHEPVFSLGGLGVDVFFVLSGFLITLLLLGEHRATGRLHFARFYGRRALRLFPALYTALAVVALYALLVAGSSDRSALLTDAGFGAVYLKNWQSALGFAGERSGPLVHLWSLALEEQFYLVWPPILALGLRARRHGLLVALCGLAVALGTLSRLLDGAGAPALAYQRADALLFGCAAGILLDRRRRTGAGGPAPAWAPGGLAALLVLTVVLLVPVGDALGSWTDRLVPSVVAALAVVVVVAVVQRPTGPAARVLSVPPLVALGRISYGLYIWHLPIFKLTPPRLLPSSPVLADVVLVALSVAVAVVSYVVVERPALRLKARLRPHEATALAGTPPSAVL